MPIAKEQIRIGFTIIANPGTYITKQAVKDNGWEALVDDGPDYGGTEDEDNNAKSARKAKGAERKAGE